MDTIGKRLKYAKEKKGLTNKELARMMGKNSPSTIISWENDTSELTISQLKELASLLDVSVGFLMDGEELKNVVTEPVPDYILVKKDDLLDLKNKLIKYQEKELEKLQKENEAQKNIQNPVHK